MSIAHYARYPKEASWKHCQVQEKKKAMRIGLRDKTEKTTSRKMGDYDHTEPPDTGVGDGPTRSQFKTVPSASSSKSPLYMQSSGGKYVLVRKLQRKEDGSWKHFTRWFVENQIGTFARNLQMQKPCYQTIL